MPTLNWGMIQDGGVFESLMHAILYYENPGIILFGRPGPDAGQDARTADGSIVYQAKYNRQGMTMDDAVKLAIKELEEKIRKYRQPWHDNYQHWQNAHQWVLVANFSINPNDDAKWRTKVVPAFQREGITAEYWDKEIHPDYQVAGAGWGWSTTNKAHVSVPEYNVQKRFAEIAKRRQIIQSETGSIEEELKAFHAALLAKAFRGEL